MEVTRKNFKETLPLVADSIEKADFLVIDAEFTGLINGRDVSVFDSPEEYYNTLFNGASDFLLIQFGLCAFYWDESAKHYMNDAYNFYLFPRGRPGPERMFLCQSSSLDFLAAQGFDFNKLIKEGISYMSEPCETRLRDNLAERQKSYSNESRINIPEEHRQQIDEICKRVRQFLDEKKSNEMEIDRCNAFIRLLLFQELGTKFKNEAFVETKILENKNRVLKVTRLTSDADGKSRDMLKKEKEWAEFEDAVGFSKVARMISQSEKLVIGHNMLLDLIHTLSHFFQPLPPDYATFKQFVHCMFPKILDTKYMSSLPPFKEKVNSNVLSHLLATLSEPPFSVPKAESQEGRGYCQAIDKAHEAGYDAYVTGLCFLGMLSHLARMRGEPLGRALHHAAAIKPFLNKVFLAKTAHQNSSYMNLTGADPNPSRDHVFHLTFPKEWSRNDINQLFSPFCAITVQFLDDTSALVGLSRREQAREVQRALAGNSRVQIVPYHRYKQPGQVPVKDKEDRRDISSIHNAHTTELSRKPPHANSSISKQTLPEKVERAQVEKPQTERQRSNSVSAPAQPQTARKRTSSGVFQVDDAEPPPPKKIELVRSHSDSGKKPETLPNGRRKTESEDMKEQMTAQKGKTAAQKEKIAAQKEKTAALKKTAAKIEKTAAQIEKTAAQIEKTAAQKEETAAQKEETAAQKEKMSAQNEKEKIVERFDADSKSKCVSAFKESDSWD